MGKQLAILAVRADQYTCLARTREHLQTCQVLAGIHKERNYVVFKSSILVPRILEGPLSFGKMTLGAYTGSEHASCHSHWVQSTSLGRLKSRLMSCFCAGLGHAIQIQPFYLVLKTFPVALVGSMTTLSF